MKKLNPRFVRTTRSYSVEGIAALYSLHPHTVREWVAKGLPCIDHRKPFLIHGSDLKAFIMGRQATRRCPCGPAEMYCCKCRLAQPVKNREATIETRNSKQLDIRGLCGVCGTGVYRSGTVAKLEEYRREFNVLSMDQRHIVEGFGPLVNPDIEKEI
ncbi:MAG: DUF5679 domain-containing protein [Alphaproteobacteria bacterium]|nr:DUF5679 domain-containing protein [Alphaproteobacteria bacterium]